MKIIFEKEDGGVGVITPSDQYELEEVISKDVPEGASFLVVESDDLPKSRNYRNAWKYKNGVEIDIEIAKKEHKRLIKLKAKQRAPEDEVGQKDFTTIRAELSKLDIDGATTLNQLYNLWPKSINNRKERRKYEI